MFAILCVELPEVQYIDLSDIAHVVKDDFIVVSVHVVVMVMYDFIIKKKFKPRIKLNDNITYTYFFRICHINKHSTACTIQ